MAADTAFSYSDESASAARGIHLPLRPNMLLMHRYMTLWVLGHKNAVVWLCWDTQERMFVAIKTVSLLANHSRRAMLEITKHKRTNKKDHSLHSERVVRMLDHFYFYPEDVQWKVREGTFVCMVFEVLGQEVSHDMVLTPRESKWILAQVLKALCCLHGSHHLIHLNLALDRILFELTPLKVREMITMAMATVHSAMYREEELRGIPAPLPGDPTFPEVLDQITEFGVHHEQLFPDNLLCEYESRLPDVKLIGLGSAVYWDYRVKGNEHMQCGPSRSFEVIMGDVIGYGTDTWSFACIAFELFTRGTKLFEPMSTSTTPSSLSQDEEYLRMMITLLGHPPAPLQLFGLFRRKYFLQDGGLRRIVIDRSQRMPMQKKLMEGGLEMNDAHQLCQLLFKILVYDVQKRPKVFDILEEPFFNV